MARYKLISDVICDGKAHIGVCNPPVPIGKQVWPGVFRNINKVFKRLEMFNETSTNNNVVMTSKTLDWVQIDCICRAKIKEIN